MDIIVIKNIEKLKDFIYYLEIEDKKVKSIGIGKHFKNNFDENCSYVEVPKTVHPIELFEEFF